MPFSWHVAFADTDSGGVVYHSRYLEWAERARAAWLLELGTSNRALAAAGVAFAVRESHIHWVRPARLDDVLSIHTAVVEVRGARLGLLQRIERDATECVRLTVGLACLDGRGAPRRIPEDLLKKIRASL